MAVWAYFEVLLGAGAGVAEDIVEELGVRVPKADAFLRDGVGDGDKVLKVLGCNIFVCPTATTKGDSG